MENQTTKSTKTEAWKALGDASADVEIAIHKIKGCAVLVDICDGIGLRENGDWAFGVISDTLKESARTIENAIFGQEV